MKRFLTLIVATVLVAFTFGGVASAEPSHHPPQGDTVTVQTAPDTYEISRRDGTPMATVKVPEKEPSKGRVGPQFDVGVGNGLYIYLTPAEQVAITGGTGGLAYLICAIPAVGTVGCAAVIASLGAAAAFIAYRGGICPGRMEIRNGGFHWTPIEVKCID